MNTDEVLERLLQGDTVSGQALSAELGITRAAVWKQIESLRQAGFVIEAEERQGYRLVSCPDSILPPMIRKGLDTEWAGHRIEYHASIDSTNRRARALAAEGAEHGTLVIADEQTAGRGRRGRGWLTPSGEGIAMSLILRPETHPSEVTLLSLQTALSVAMAIRRVTGLDARIKWPNDIVCKGRKLVGMLLEMDADEEAIRDIVAGIGINVHQQSFGEDISSSASSLDLLTGTSVSRADVIRAWLEEFEKVVRMEAENRENFMNAYRRLSATLGQHVHIIGVRDDFTGIAEDITPSGSLIVRADGSGELREVLAADVSVRGIMGYV